MTDDSSGSFHTCLELALEGERLCKQGNCRKGIHLFETAIQVGTKDLKTLSAIYSQLGNAYFYLQNYLKALEYHQYDLNVAKMTNDMLGEAKAHGNLCNTLKALGNFQEALLCCQKHIDISVSIDDKTTEARAYYNMGNVHYSVGKYSCSMSGNVPGMCPTNVQNSLLQAIRCYKRSLEIATELSDNMSMGRCIGNVGNVFYLLGDFQEAIKYHRKRLELAIEQGDAAGMRRAHSNLGNCLIFAKQFKDALNHYEQSLVLSKQLGDAALEAQVCYSLGNVYSLLNKSDSAIQFHRLHLNLAKQFNDKVGQARGWWSLYEIYKRIEDLKNSEECLERYLKLTRKNKEHITLTHKSAKLFDSSQTSSTSGSSNSKNSPSMATTTTITSTTTTTTKNLKPPLSDSLSLSDCFTLPSQYSSLFDYKTSSTAPTIETDADTSNLGDMLNKLHSRRLDDQRCSEKIVEVATDSPGKQSISPACCVANISAGHYKTPVKKSDDLRDENDLEDVVNMLAKLQGDRMETQRSLPPSPVHIVARSNPNEASASFDDDGNLVDLIESLQSQRIDDQRVVMPSQSSSVVRKSKKQSKPSNTDKQSSLFKRAIFKK